jgi:hypothetical protein
MPAGADAGRDELRRARRRFVRDNHPDRGGDPVAFACGLAAFDRGARPTGTVSVHRRPGVPALLVRRLSRRWRRRRHPRVT